MTVLDSTLTSEFNDKADSALPNTEFFNYLYDKFYLETALKVGEVFQKLKLPVPQANGEFLKGTEGVLVFLNRYGLVGRIEQKDTRNVYSSRLPPDRINDSPWVLKPLASIDAGRVVIEICPGCHPKTSEKNVNYLRKQLGHEDIEYWDSKIGNNGRLPVKTPSFPEGVPIVVDRLAVRRLSDNIEPVRQVLKKAAREAAEAQENLHGPLRKAFEEAWPDKSGSPDAKKMKQFWTLCQRYAEEGKLVAGWNEFEGYEYSKPAEAAKSAKQYESRLNARDPAVLVAQSRLQPVRV